MPLIDGLDASSSAFGFTLVSIKTLSDQVSGVGNLPVWQPVVVNVVTKSEEIHFQGAELLRSISSPER
jgi:hypothetical protein